MARKFADIDVDGGRGNQSVAVKIDAHTGLFEAEIQGTKVESDTFAGIKKAVEELTRKLDALTLEPFYQLHDGYSSIGFRAVLLSKEKVPSRCGFRGESKDVRISFKVSMDDELNVDVDSFEEGHPMQETKKETRFLPCTEKSRRALLHFQKEKEVLRERERSLREDFKRLDESLRRFVESHGLTGDQVFKAIEES